MATKRVNGSEAGTSEPEDDESVIVGTMGDVPESVGESGIPIVEPATIAYEPDATEQPRKRRGRQPGSRNTNSRAAKETANDLTGLLFSMHTMMAAFTGIEELELEESEAKKLGEAINRVNQFYGNVVLPPKAMAWAHLGFAVGQVYGPRFVAYGMRKKKEAKEKPQTINATGARIH